MSELIKDFIKFVGEVMILIMILSVVFSPEGIASQTFYYIIFSEPILLQNYISTAVSVADQTPGEFLSNIKTLGEPYIIKIYKENEIFYVLILPTTRPYQGTMYTGIQPAPIKLSNCNMKEKVINLNRTIGQNIKVQKTLNNNVCDIEVLT